MSLFLSTALSRALYMASPYPVCSIAPHGRSVKALCLTPGIEMQAFIIRAILDPGEDRERSLL
jgi:hypothetical protein